MKLRSIALAMACSILFSGCHVIHETRFTTRYTDLWQSQESDDGQPESIGVATSQPEKPTEHKMPDPTRNPNYVPIGEANASGSREFLLADSIKQENGVITALIEYHYPKPQKSPATGAWYAYNRWFEQIDCTNSIRTIRTTTHYSANGEIVDANEFPLPKYTADQLKLLSQPNDGVIREVCKRVGQPNGVVQTAPKPPADNPPPARQDAKPAENATGQPENKVDTANKPAVPAKTNPSSKGIQVSTEWKHGETANQKQPEKPAQQFVNNQPAASKPETAPKSTQPEKTSVNNQDKAKDAAPPPKVVASPPKEPEPEEEEYEEPPLPDDFWEIGKENLPPYMR
ncbi:hypothetical protein [Wielerella bovis]|uniref:hypothetical protein n=1 Tax=Wielerella bovis TaxID=2917790 RepID=UPI0020197B94|nr:hypothetical protein [Wielerella bovis]ULJ63982.1 hypothetical protein MIS33_07365 [Wielerella bovis]ULJ68037.1 hypothetical protein MIS31_05770 [Wielerella bovis]